MARILNINIPDNKRVEVGLTAIYGIGRSLSNQILQRAEVNRDKKVSDLTEEELTRIRQIAAEYTTEGTLRREVSLNLRRLNDISTYRAIRKRHHLPSNGQRTRSNARTCKGPRKTVANKKKATQKT